MNHTYTTYVPTYIQDSFLYFSITYQVSSVGKFRESLQSGRGREGPAPAAAAAAFVRARLGPTNDLQPTFCWSGLETQYVHVGQPDCFDFAWTDFPVV